MNDITTHFNLSAYLKRIGFIAQPQCDLDTLHALTRAQSQSIAFENIDVLLGRGVPLGEQAIFDKLVHAHHGGYCFEQNILLQKALQYLGFEVMPLGGRVRLGYTDRQDIPARTHLFLKVRLGEDEWVTDVGFGSFSLTGALRLEPALVQHTPHGLRRFEREEERWFQQAWVDEQWLDLYEFDPSLEMLESDQKVANWYTQTHEDTHFTYRLSVAIALADGGRAALLDRRFRQVDAHGQSQVQEINSAAQLAALLSEVFGLYRQNDVKALWEKIHLLR